MPITRAQQSKISQNIYPTYKHHSTPTKARILGACDYLDAKGIKGEKASVFKHFGVSKARGWAILREGQDRRRLGVDTRQEETRGRPPLISPEGLRKMERIIEDCDVEGRSMSWETLAYESGLDVSARTVKRAMGTLDYHKRIACRKGWVNKATAAKRLGPQGHLRIIRKPGERYCVNCIQHTKEPDEQDKKKLHCWAAVGYRFKSSLVFYNIDSNTNGKMTQKAYINQILDPIVKPWIKDQQDFALEEDRDSGHGTGINNIVKQWKKENGLKSYFNCGASPDLAPIENAWAPMKQYVRGFAHWDIETTEQLTQEGWDSVQQQYIDQQVLSMPQRLRDVRDIDGAMTGW
ncbi:hypothetical protein BU23DRAFT_604932 [Bimuria novae-zelandiae CBS 107.79]|uniref:Tc1-like transposase DDE domain-containing protein n=1 Tax=Bimuria novae-zelandiae CBS 107.79 TaxID=1447943 RepID=A0A6A5UIP9_9PLEO|nr:hypothetical protein BU23DRAFT_604932 [Bimuria novae-zelandiae CBS 107.79]